ncbi:MAG TPA: VWA domain-containing protein [Gemmataceae bacterium]|nr:VWA domain-containing protein [Gemmataceae bacterium]
MSTNPFDFDADNSPAPPSGGDDWGADLLSQGVEFADNPEPRCPCVLLLDTSKSMAGPRIQALNDGLVAFHDELLKDPLASQRVEVAIVTFGGKQPEVIQDFVTVDQFAPPLLQAAGKTLMGGGIHLGLDLLESRKAQYKAHGVAYYRPWVFMLTDGQPQGEPPDLIETASQRIRADEQGKRVAFFAVGVEGANMDKLAQVSARKPVKLKGLRFVDMFVWLSRSTQTVANSNPGDQVALPPVNWGTL